MSRWKFRDLKSNVFCRSKVVGPGSLAICVLLGTVGILDLAESDLMKDALETRMPPCYLPWCVFRTVRPGTPLIMGRLQSATGSWDNKRLSYISMLNLHKILTSY